MNQSVALIIGHSKTKPGACNNTYNICEYEFNINIVQQISKNLRIPYDVVFRRSYSSLPSDINQLNPLFAVSFHCNAFNTKVSGSEVLYHYRSKEGKRLAMKFQEEIVSVLGLNNRGIKPIKEDDRGGYLLQYTMCPTIILEPFFIDNDNDFEIVDEKLDELINSLTNVIESEIMFHGLNSDNFDSDFAENDDEFGERI